MLLCTLACPRSTEAREGWFDDRVSSACLISSYHHQHFHPSEQKCRGPAGSAELLHNLIQHTPHTVPTPHHQGSQSTEVLSTQQHRHEEGLEGWTGGCGGGWQGCCRNSAIEEGCEEGCASEEGRQEGISCRCSGSCCDWWWQEGRQGRQGWQGWQEEVVWHCSGLPPCFRCSM